MKNTNFDLNDKLRGYIPEKFEPNKQVSKNESNLLIN